MHPWNIVTRNNSQKICHGEMIYCTMRLGINMEIQFSELKHYIN